MRALLTTALLFSLAGAASADELRKGETPRYRGFDGNLAEVTGPIALDVRIGEHLLYLAVHDGDRPGVNRLRAGFATGGHLGLDPLEGLAEDMGEELHDELTDRGIRVDPNAPTVLRVTLVDAVPNRPTFDQLSVEPSLSYSSFGVGGASMEGELITADGQSSGAFTYGWYETQLDEFSRTGTWIDANRAIDFMARKVAKKLS